MTRLITQHKVTGEFVGLFPIEEINRDPDLQQSILPLWMTPEGIFHLQVTSPASNSLLIPDADSPNVNKRWNGETAGWIDMSSIPAGMLPDGNGGFFPLGTTPPPIPDNNVFSKDVLMQSATLRAEVPEIRSHYAFQTNGLDQATTDCWLTAMNTWTARELKNGAGTGCNISSYDNKLIAVQLVQHYGLIMAGNTDNNHQLARTIVAVRESEGLYTLV